MKQIKRSFVILGLVSIALILKALKEANAMMMVIALLLILLLIGRIVLFKNALKNEEMELDYSETEFIFKYLKEKPVYVKMYNIYKEGNCEVLYEEIDGLLLYDHTRKIYLASARSLEGAKDIVRMIPQDYGALLAFEDIFEKIENVEFPMVKKEKEDIIYYYSK